MGGDEFDDEIRNKYGKLMNRVLDNNEYVDEWKKTPKVHQH